MKKYFIGLLAILLLYACKDIFERNLAKSSITLLSPPDNIQTSALTQNFWWDPVKGATKYQLQVVTPDFTSITQLMLDTTIAAEQFSYTLKPGKFCWRVRAMNNSSNTEYATRCMSIDSNPDLSAQQLVLASPVSNYATTQSSITFKWYKLINADDYRFELRSPDFSGSLVLNPAIITDTIVTLTALAEGKYEWGVRGQNTFSNTAFSQRKFIIDATAPSAPALLTPASNDTLHGSSMDFTWTQAIDSGSVISDSLWIYSDTINWTVKKGYYTSAITQNVDTLPLGTYYWDMKAMDAAGNKSGYSTLRKFIVK